MPFTIDSIINALNQVEVKGRDNMDRLLGAIFALEQIKDAQKAEIQPTEKIKNVDPLEGNIDGE